MASAYSQDLRDRVIDAVIRGGMSRRAAAARFGVSESSAIKWAQRFERSGSRAASRMGGYLRPKLEPHREFLEALRGDKSDITLKALCHRLLVERGVKADTSPSVSVTGRPPPVGRMPRIDRPAVRPNLATVV
jgi:transposase